MSCLFQSLSAFIQNTDAAMLRHIIADYLEKNPVLYDEIKMADIVAWEEGSPSLQHYVARMRMQSTWGGAIEIKAFCDMFHVCVDVVVLRDRKSIRFEPSTPPPSFDSEKRVFSITWNGYHYEPLFH